MPDMQVGSAVVATPTTRIWDYEVITVHARHNDVLQEKLTEQGQEGWELVFMAMPIPNEYQCVFRRSVR
jgi:hypothetical protein